MMLVDIYIKILQRLNFEKRLEVISRLSQSMMEEKKSNAENFFSLYGAFNSDQTADELIEEIRASRTFNREIEAF